MLDSDLADLYEVETKNLKRLVKRNIDRFPEDFMFELTDLEVKALRCQTGTLNNGGRGEHSKYSPFVFSEQGVACLSGILKSNKAVEINLQIIRAFINLRKLVSTNNFVLDKFNNIDKKHLEYETKFDKIFNLIESEHIKPKQGIFFNGEVFDSYKFINSLIKKAKTEIILIDNYIDETTLTLFSTLNSNIKIIILTKNISNKLKLDFKKFKSQYFNLDIELKYFNLSHDRFLIIDSLEIYHIGASLKDLGKKWFAFSKLDINNTNVLKKINLET